MSLAPDPPSGADRPGPPPARPLHTVVGALRWSDASGYDLDAPRVGRLLGGERGPGAPGFILFGGPADAAREAGDILRARAGHPLLLGADLERGAGQQFRGATPLPPLAALASLDDARVLRVAGELTGREARALGVPWVFAPVADLDVEPDNPIVGTRSPGADPVRVAHAVAAWIRGCLDAGALPCVKHFPGHGRTRSDSHRELPRVETDGATLLASDLEPFAAAVEAGVPSVMTAHVAYPALDPSGAPATRSGPILRGLLRERLGFDGVVVSDALIMEGAAPGGDARAAAREARGAGVDLLLYPPDEMPLLELSGGALQRVRRLLAAVPSPSRSPSGSGGDEAGWGRREDRARSLAWGIRACRWMNGGTEKAPSTPVLSPGAGATLTVVDDDVGGPYPAPGRTPFTAALREAGIRVDPEEDPRDPRDGSAILAVFADPRAWKGRAGLSPASREAVEAWAAAHRGGAVSRPGRPVVVVFGGPRILADLPAGLGASAAVLHAWGGEAIMQEAAAAVLTGRVP